MAKSTNKVDLFQADKAMSERVSKFMNAKVWGIVYRKRAEQDIKSFEGSIEAKKRLEGSILWEEKQAEIAKLEQDIADTKEALKKNLEENATFDYTEADNAFYKAYKDAEDVGTIYEAIITWFKGYGLELTVESMIELENNGKKVNTSLVDYIYAAIAGERKATASVIIKSGATQFTIAKRVKNDVLCVFYGKLSEVMLQKGTLKATEIPADIREMYAPQKKEKKSN